MRRAASRAWRVALLLGAAVQPWCEAGALEHAQRRLATRGVIAFEDWDLDIDGMHLHGVAVELRGHRVAAERVSVTPDASGISVRARGLSAEPSPPRAASPSSTSAPTPDANATRTREPWRIDTHGVPVHVRGEGTLALPLPGGATASIEDPSVDIDATGIPTLRAAASLTTPDLDRVGVLAIEIPSVVVTRDAGGWLAEATASIDGGPSLHIGAARPDRGDARVVIDDSSGGRIELTAGDSHALTAHATAFGLDALGPTIVSRARSRGVGLGEAHIDGVLQIDRDERLRVHGEALTVSGLVLDDRRLAPRPVVLDALALDGDITITASDQIEAQLVLGHREAQVALAAALDGDHLQLELELAELGCTELLASLPRGMADVLAGARLSGTIDGRASLAISFEALARARLREQQQPDAEPEPPPGTLALEFAFLERCTTVAPPASVDLEGLRGAWRHRFLGDDGRTRERVLAPGAIDFVPLGQASHAASAFIALEDMRFWFHDGFDREQIERAFWHNLKNGRVRRGASTISQQAARNIWLGVDRSLARKLQEAYLTALLEAGVSKTRILELYVNLVELGPGIYGVDAAARHHFGIPADQLDVLQSIHLAALAPAPRTFSERFASGHVDEAWLTTLRDHARRMYRNRMITASELQTALHAELHLVAH